MYLGVHLKLKTGREDFESALRKEFLFWTFGPTCSWGTIVMVPIWTNLFGDGLSRYESSPIAIPIIFIVWIFYIILKKNFKNQIENIHNEFLNEKIMITKQDLIKRRNLAIFPWVLTFAPFIGFIIYNVLSSMN